MTKELYRSKNERVIAGVVGGIAQYFNQNVLLWRLGVLFATLSTGVFPGVIVYAVAWYYIPNESILVTYDIPYQS
jgi:phage shock protein C